MYTHYVYTNNDYTNYAYLIKVIQPPPARGIHIIITISMCIIPMISIIMITINTYHNNKC